MTKTPASLRSDPWPIWFGITGRFQRNTQVGISLVRLWSLGHRRDDISYRPDSISVGANLRARPHLTQQTGVRCFDNAQERLPATGNVSRQQPLGNRQQSELGTQSFQSFNRFAPFKTFYKRMPKHCDVIEADNISRARIFY